MNTGHRKGVIDPVVGRLSKRSELWNVNDCNTMYTVYRLGKNMATSNILTVRMQDDELIKLDELAKLQNRSRSQLVQDALRELIHSCDQFRLQDFRRLKACLAPAV